MRDGIGLTFCALYGIYVDLYVFKNEVRLPQVIECVLIETGCYGVDVDGDVYYSSGFRA